MKPGDLVFVLHPGFSSPPLGVVIEQQDGTHLFRVMLLGEDNNNLIFRYSSTILRKVDDIPNKQSLVISD